MLFKSENSKQSYIQASVYDMQSTNNILRFHANVNYLSKGSKRFNEI